MAWSPIAAPLSSCVAYPAAYLLCLSRHTLAPAPGDANGLATQDGSTHLLHRILRSRPVHELNKATALVGRDLGVHQLSKPAQQIQA
eukprot:712780-Pelagomonas_calceolata.AAC.5